jgi:hypothetical protein
MNLQLACDVADAPLHSRCWPAWCEAQEGQGHRCTGGGGDHGAIDRLEKQGQQSKHSPSDAARELRTAENRFAFQRQINGV